MKRRVAMILGVGLAACTHATSAPDAGSVEDSGMTVADSGYVYDSGYFYDAGTSVDAGPVDAGMELDSGAADAGSAVDAGTEVDAGPYIDAGPYDAGGINVVTIAGNGAFGHMDGTGGADGGAEFDYPQGVAMDSSGSIYVADSDNQCIRKISPQGNVTTLAGNGSFGSTDGTGGAMGMAQFISPTGVAVDSHYNVYVADDGNDQIRMIDPMGNTTTVAGVGDAGYMDGVGDVAEFWSPAGIAVDIHDNLYVADELNFRIRKIDSSGNVTTLAGNGMSGYMDGAAAVAEFGDPAGIAVDTTGNVYIADSSNNDVRMIDPTGNVTTLAGNGMQGWMDGTGGAMGTAQFLNPMGVAVDSQMNVYVADVGNNRIRKIDPMGNVTTLAGNGDYGFADGTGGYGGMSEFRNASGVCVDSMGNVFVADSGNSRIREITQSNP